MNCVSNKVGVRCSKASLNAAQYDEDSVTIKAPFTGIVLARDAEIGDTVGPGQRVFRIADLNSFLVAKAAVPTQVARELHVGEAAQIRVGPGEKVLSATIRFVGALVAPTVYQFHNASSRVDHIQFRELIYRLVIETHHKEHHSP